MPIYSTSWYEPGLASVPKLLLLLLKLEQRHAGLFYIWPSWQGPARLSGWYTGAHASAAGGACQVHVAATVRVPSLVSCDVEDIIRCSGWFTVLAV
jgi:hypothetical protein